MSMKWNLQEEIDNDESKMRKNLIHLLKKCLKYSAVLFLIIVLLRYTLKINLSVSTNVSNYRSNVEKFKYIGADNNRNRSSASLVEFDLSFSLVDSLTNEKYSANDFLKNSHPVVDVHNFSSFLNSKYFYYDREFNNESETKIMCPYVPDNIGI